jgi:hypothetical protein
LSADFIADHPHRDETQDAIICFFVSLIVWTATLCRDVYPRAEHDADEWQAAMEALLLVAEHDGSELFARIGVMRAFNLHVVRVFNPSRKDTHWGRRKLKRDAL